MLTIAAINLQSGIGTTKGYRQYIASLPLYLLPGDDRFVKKAAQLLAQERVDIALCTEVNEISFRSTRTSHVQTIEATLKPIASAFFPTIKTGTYLHEGNAIFSAYPLTHIHAHSLVRRIIPRVLGEVMTTVDGVSVTVLVTHLSLSKKT